MRISLLILPIGAALLLHLLLVSTLSAQDLPARVEVRRTQTRNAQASIQLLGTARPVRNSVIGGSVAGRVATLHAGRGDFLKAGDPIVELQTTVVRIEEAAAEAEANLAEQQLKELEAGTRTEDIAEAKARMAAAQALAKQTAGQLARITELVTSGAASNDELDTAAAESESSKQLLLASKIAYDRLVAGPRKEQIAQAKARVALQRERVKLLQDRLKKHTIYAPFDGYITQEFTADGAWLTAGDPVVELVELDSIEVEVAVPASQVVNLSRDQQIRMDCLARPMELLVGNLHRIVPTADTRARTYPVLIRVKNEIKEERPSLLAGMMFRVYLPAGDQTQQSVFVPTDAIVLNKDYKSVFVASQIAEDGTATVKEVVVELNIADGPWIAVEGDIQPGQHVVIRGNERLKSGDRVLVRAEDAEVEAVGS